MEQKRLGLGDLRLRDFTPGFWLVEKIACCELLLSCEKAGILIPLISHSSPATFAPSLELPASFVACK
jgi:hypothetical protein